MWSPFRKKHLELVLESSLRAKTSLDLHMHKYFTTNHSLGSKDRLWIKQGVYEIFKWKELLSTFGATTAKEFTEIYTGENSPIGQELSHLPSHVQVSFPKWLMKKIIDSLGYEAAMEFCKLSNTEAPVTIRVNTARCTREEFLKKYKDELGLIACINAPNGFNLEKRAQFKSMEDFQKGFFEPQDEASQLIAKYVAAKKDQHILDYCAGSGGKALAFAPDMLGKGQIHLHDIREKPLIDAKKRLKRAGIQNFQIYSEGEKRLKGLIGNMDTVLVDAPCSCTGTLRRRPDQKWILTEAFIDDITKTQRDIVIKAIPYLKKGGLLIYATCSILKQENQDQTAFFKERDDLTFLSEHYIPLTVGGSDAMYLSLFQKNSLV